MIVRMSVLIHQFYSCNSARAARDPVDGVILNSERGLAERILSRAAYHLNRRTICPALDAGILPQLSACVRELSACVREMRILGSHPGMRLQFAKLALLAGKVLELEIFGYPESQKEKKSHGDTLNLPRFFQGTMFAPIPVALTISSPETNSVCPQAKAGLLEP
jgi:hypothetical protein